MNKVLLVLTVLACAWLTQSKKAHLAIDDLKITYINPDYYDGLSFSAGKDENANPTLNFVINNTKDLGSNIKVNAALLKLVEDGNYVTFFNVDGIDFCNAMRENTLGVGDLFTSSGNMTLCPWKANRYVLDNAPLSFLQIPESFEAGAYKSKTTFYYGDTKLAEMISLFTYTK